MAFPGTYNFTYYRGDTFQFKIYPKTSNGSTFDLAGFSASFRIAPVRGDAGIPDQIECLASIDSTNGSVTCVILPEQGRKLVAGTQYVYDAEIKKSQWTQVGSQIIPAMLTMLTGSITVSEDVGSYAPSTDTGNVYYKIIYMDSYNTIGKIPVDNNLYVTNQPIIIKPAVSDTDPISRPGYTLYGWNNASTDLSNAIFSDIEPVTPSLDMKWIDTSGTSLIKDVKNYDGTSFVNISKIYKPTSILLSPANDSILYSVWKANE